MMFSLNFKKNIGCIIDSQNKEDGLTKIEK